MAQTYYQIQVSWDAIRSEKFHDALTSAKKAITLTPTNDEAHVVLGLTYYLLGDTAASATTFRQALQINPKMNGMVQYYFKEYSIVDEDFVQKIFRK